MSTYISLSLCDLDSVLLETNEELTSIDLSVSIIGVEEFEGSTKTSDGGCTSGIQLLSQSVQDYLVTINKKPFKLI